MDAAQKKAAEAGTIADREFAQQAQAPLTAEDQARIAAWEKATTDDPANPERPSVFAALLAKEQAEQAAQAAAAEKPTAPAIDPATGERTITWAERKARAKMASLASHANPNAAERIEETVRIVGGQIVEMTGSKYDYSTKAVILLEDGGALDVYGAAGVESVASLVNELGPGPWPEALPVLIEGIETKWSKGEADQPRLVPQW